MNNLLSETVRSVAEGKPKGGARLDALLNQATRTERLQLFIPWAAPPGGRTKLTYETETLDWLTTIVAKLGSLVTIQATLMPADSYAARNGYDMTQAEYYWTAVAEAAAERLGDTASVRVLPASAIEDAPTYADYLACRSYVFESLPQQQQAKIVAAASKYTGTAGQAAYESAADYAMRRAAEADYVSNELSALWISLNYPERDVMCGDTPRFYAPEAVRTPWLKEGR